jgi:hypothetical protein
MSLENNLMTPIEKLTRLMRLSRIGISTDRGLFFPALYTGEAFYQYTALGKLIHLDPDGTGTPCYTYVTPEIETNILKKLFADELDVITIRYDPQFGYCAVDKIDLSAV